MNEIAPFSAYKPFMVLPGNHEAECHTCITAIAQTGKFTAYNTRFRMPSGSSGGAASMWYSFNSGCVRGYGQVYLCEDACVREGGNAGFLV